MMVTKAVFHCKETEVDAKKCAIVKTIRLDSDGFQYFSNNLCQYHDFIKENNHIGGTDEFGNQHCILVLDRDGEDGILVNTEGYEYAKYTSYMPGAKYFVEALQETQSMKFYCPLTAETYEGMDEYERQMADEGHHVNPADYEDNIRDKIMEDSILDGRGLASYLDDRLQDTVWSIVPDVEIIGDTLYGVFNLEITEELSQQEFRELRDYCIGQAADGWGEGFEQREIKTLDGEIYVHFWHSEDDYFMLTEAEFEARMSGQTLESKPDELSIWQKFEAKIMKNYEGFVKRWSALSQSELIEQAEVIALTKHTFDSLNNGGWDYDYVENLMRFENPLEVVRDQCQSEQEMSGSADMGTVLCTLLDTAEIDAEVYALDPNYIPPDQSQGMNMQ